MDTAIWKWVSNTFKSLTSVNNSPMSLWSLKLVNPYWIQHDFHFLNYEQKWPPFHGLLKQSFRFSLRFPKRIKLMSPWLLWMYSLFFSTINMFCTVGELHFYNLTVWCCLNAQYCRLYFSESLTCGFKMCRFQHLPAEGDEKVHSDLYFYFIYFSWFHQRQ